MGIGILIYLLLAGLMGYMALFYLQFSTMQIFGIFSIVPLLILAVLISLRKKINCYLEESKVVCEMSELGKKANVSVFLVMENQSRFFPLSKAIVFLTFKNEFSGEKGRKKIMMSVDSITRKTKECCLPIKHCGTIEVSIQKVRIYDYFGLFRFTVLKSGKTSSIAVLPPLQEVYMDESILLGEGDYDSGRYSPYKSGDDPSEVFAIRDFKEGDKLQQIHWKLSMKKSSLMVKEYSFPLAQSTTVFVDFCVKGSNRLDQIDRLIQGVYSVSTALLDKQVPQRFYWYDTRVELMKTCLVTTEEELLWAFQEMFTAHVTEDEEELVASYIKWGQGKPHMTGLYLTATDGKAAAGADLNVSKLYIVDVSSGSPGGGKIGE